MTNLENKKLVAVSIMTNPLGETFIFGQFGKSPKNNLVSTLQYVEEGCDNDKLVRFWERRIGKKFSEIEKIREGIQQNKEL